MKEITIKFSNEQRSYPIFIGSDIVGKIAEFFDLAKYSKLFILTDEIIKPLLLEKLVSGLPTEPAVLVVPAGEKEKNIVTVGKMWKAMLDAGCDRKSLVINLGGGVVTDMGGFAAATYMRGVEFINIPTTLLSQVDASVGGKTGIDFATIKNLVGTFTQPNAVILDTETLKTLPKREFLSGFGEIIKHGLIADSAYFEKVTAKKPLEFTAEELVDIITISCQKKAEVVIGDEKEGDKRKLLNFGHTIGHALEALSLATATPLLHGEAVSIGMVAEAKISTELGLLSSADAARVENSLKNAGLPTTALNIEIDKVKEKMRSDKKNIKGTINFVLLKNIGEAVADQQVADEIVTNGLHYINK